MEHSQITWEEVTQFEEIKGYGQQIWRCNGQYYFVTNEGGIAEQRVVYELSNDLFELIESGEKSLAEVHYKLKNDAWPPEITQKEADKMFLRDNPELLINDAKNQALFTKKELDELLPEGSAILASSDIYLDK